MGMEGHRIITTAGELAELANVVDATTPVVLSAAEIEPGADLDREKSKVLVAGLTVLPANADGAVAARGEPVVFVADVLPEGVTRRVAGVRVLQMRERWTLQPGQLGPHAVPADAAVRRAEAFDRPDDDMTYYLLEVQASMDALRAELEDALRARHQPIGPAARRRVERSIDAVAAARLEIADAVRYGNVCDLAQLAVVDDDLPCDPHRSGDVWVYLPDPGGEGLGSEELGCHRHATVAVRTIAGSRLGSPETSR
ncbi:hypothetical protein GCM10009733_020080 [Nonomuraea maheshkhaliensis]|uniref:Uncharacterized protein n=1 Tax=Nonomuraea maheshkhaliensis TaxID=419590 RepID=A0ABP4QWW3_9ACTN